MQRLAALVAGAALLAMAGFAAAPADSEDIQQPPTEVTQPDPCLQHLRPAEQHRELARRIFAPKRWERSQPARGHFPMMRELRSCADPRALEAMRRRWHTERRQFFRYRLYRQIAPYRAPAGIGYGPPRPADKRWWAIPTYIVCGESHFDFYVNADGAYQIIPSTWAAYGGLRFAPTAGAATPLQQHIIAAAAWGLTPWYGAC